jgi:GcrA cell cycle regulator
MSWTDERVERLSTLWLEGRSASQIAAELGEGVSRNAVIGKVHRLGLSGRAVPPADAAAPRIRDLSPTEPVSTLPSAAEPAAVEPVPHVPEIAPVAAPPRAAPEAAAVAAHRVDDVASILDAARERMTIDLPALRAVKDAAIPISDRVTILELNGSMCRWPIGDPTSAEFRFCGCRAVGTLPYCQEHARVAFQPVADRRRTERMIRIM